MSILFAIDPSTGAEFYSYRMYGGPQFGEESGHTDPLPSYVQEAPVCGSCSRYLYSSGEATTTLVLALVDDSRWELWRTLTSEIYPSDDWEMVGYTKGPLVERSVAEWNLMIGHLALWFEDYETEEGDSAELSLSEPDHHYHAWSDLAFEDDIMWFYAPEPGPELVKYLGQWINYGSDLQLLELMMGSDPTVSWQYLLAEEKANSGVAEIVEEICKACGVDRSSPLEFAHKSAS